MSTPLTDTGESGSSDKTPIAPPKGPRGGGLQPRMLATLVLLIVIAGGVALLTSSDKSKPAGAGSAKNSGFMAAGIFSPPRPAPPIALRNYLGQPVNIDSYRGKAVLVTFLYTHCPDVCPLITSQLRVAQNLMGPATRAKLQIIAVSVDPRGDTRKAVATFLARHGMTGRMLYLTGSPRELAAVWRAWGVGSERDTSQPQFVNHTGIVFGVDSRGEQTTFYSPEFKPSEIAHDVPLLASR